MKFPLIDIIFILVAMCGGLANYLDRFLKGKEIFSFIRIIASILVCGFTGYMTAEVMLIVQPSWALVASGIGRICWN